MTVPSGSSATRELAPNGVRGDENAANFAETTLPRTGLLDREERLHSQISVLPDFASTESIKPQCHYRIHSRRTPCWYVASERRHDQ
jgi:hypothetical protein